MPAADALTPDDAAAPVAVPAGMTMWPQGIRPREVSAGSIRWRIVRIGRSGAPKALLIHGTGASAHSFAPLARLLGDHIDMLVFDLPGHGATGAPGRAMQGLPGYAGAVRALIEAEHFGPAYIVGHSAGAAIGIEMCLRLGVRPKRLFGINSALKPVPSVSLWSPMARFLSALPGWPSMMAWQARLGAVDNLLARTGSAVPAASAAAYRNLFADPSHIRCTVEMMAGWDLVGLDRDLPKLATPTSLIAAQDDPMVSPDVSRAAAARMPAGEWVGLSSGGHLVHEAHPDRVARIILDRLEPEEAP